MKEKKLKYNLRSRVRPQKASRDARGLIERPIGCQPKTWVRRESQHAARDERSETKHKREKRAKRGE
jgi:hypothetical protein